MLELLRTFLTSKQFIPHGHCYLWKPELVGLHIVSDCLIALAYYSIPITLLYLVRKRQSLPFNWMFLLFATFIVTCGTTHLMEIWTLWHPTYWLSGSIKAITALISLYTAFALIPLVPKALALPSPTQLEATNRELEREISDRKRAELALYEREAMLRRIGDNLPNGAVYQAIRELDGSDCFSYLSAGIERLMEVSAEDALRDPSLLYRQFIPEDTARFQAGVEESVRNLSVFDIQLQIKTPSCQLKWLHFRSTPRQLPNGRVVCDGLVVDVTEIKHTEETLRKSEALLEESQRVARLGNWEHNLATGKLTWSKELFSLFNRNLAQLEPNYKELLELYHPEDRQKLHQAVERAIATGESYKLILRVPQPDGSYRYFEAIGNVEFNAQGQVIRLYGTAQDVTERQQAQIALQVSEERLQLALEASGDGFWDWNLVTQEVYYSPCFLEMLGYSCDELPKNLSTWERLVHPDDKPWVEKILAAHLKDNSVPYKFDYRLGTKSGEWKWIADYGKVVMRDDNGRALRMAGTHRDISDRKQAESALAKSEEQFRLTLEFTNIGIWDWNLQTGEVIWNDNHFRLLGLEPKTATPSFELWRDSIHPEDVDQVQQILFKALKQHTNYEAEHRVIHPSGKVHWLLGKGRGIYNEAGDPIRMLGVIIDINEQKLAEESLRRYERIVATTTDAISLLNRNYIYQVVNQAYQNWCGKPKEEIVGHCLDEIVGQEMFESVIKPRLNKCLAGEKIQYEMWFNYPDKESQFLNITYAPYLEADQTISGVLVSIRDMTELKRTEEALQESEARFQAFMDNSPALAWITDATGRVVYLSQSYLRTFELLPNQAIGQSIFDLYPLEIAQQFMSNSLIVAETNQVLGVIEVAPRTDGTLGEFLVYKFPIPGLSEQKLVGGVAIDITERKILERELAHKQELLDAFITSAPVGITVLDQQLRYSLINEALAEMNGIPAAMHIGKTVWEIVPDIAPKQEQVFRYVLTTGEPILDFEISGETPKLPGVIRTWLASYFAIESEADQPIGLGIVVVEITERKRAEKMLELQAIITRNVAEGICLIRAADKIIVYANHKFEQMFGYEDGELTGQHVSILNYEEEYSTSEQVTEAIMATILKHGEASYEVHNVKKDGTSFWCRAATSVFEHPEFGNVFVAVQQDITEHKQADEQIKASLKEKEVLLQEIHHRVKNNLGIVSSLLEMQCRRTKEPQAIAILRDSQNRIASIALVHEKLYRSEELADINFAQYIPDLTTHLFDSYNDRSSDIRLNIQVDDAKLDIETAIPCGLIINELVSNALKYAFPVHREGEIQVRLYQQYNQNLILIIRDNGVGLPENFDSKKAKTLGINLVQGLVKQLRGTLEIKCQQGTEFKITFTKNRA
ncbi:MAG: PAS domain S-box protein [Mojavia pulchra JT2-VF2]|jgi:PAS domain S-box-containing protein|uniref:histidine kinase n=1 Tax=Mojavia pulchra JT2-VF2 TaxID=287848 RepID=A0A951PZX5_9NOST|nr:PAS domain S-box protein [Mojavia pulchra JT2-VF2]